MAAELIGLCRCPLCRSDKARLTLAKTGLPVLTCNACNFQGFARSDRSDEAMRALLATEPAPTPAPAPADPPEPQPAPKPAEPPTPQHKPEPAPVKKPAFTWGAFPGL